MAVVRSAPAVAGKLGPAPEVAENGSEQSVFPVFLNIPCLNLDFLVSYFSKMVSSTFVSEDFLRYFWGFRPVLSASRDRRR